MPRGHWLQKAPTRRVNALGHVFEILSNFIFGISFLIKKKKLFCGHAVRSIPEPRPLASKVQSPNHRTTREFPRGWNFCFVSEVSWDRNKARAAFPGGPTQPVFLGKVPKPLPQCPTAAGVCAPPCLGPGPTPDPGAQCVRAPRLQSPEGHLSARDWV